MCREERCGKQRFPPRHGRELLPELAGERDRFQFVHATGVRDLAEVRQSYAQAGIRARVEPFFEEMAVAYQAADFVTGRTIWHA